MGLDQGAFLDSLIAMLQRQSATIGQQLSNLRAQPLDTSLFPGSSVFQRFGQSPASPRTPSPFASAFSGNSPITAGSLMQSMSPDALTPQQMATPSGNFLTMGNGEIYQSQSYPAGGTGALVKQPAGRSFTPDVNSTLTFGDIVGDQ